MEELQLHWLFFDIGFIGVPVIVIAMYYFGGIPIVYDDGSASDDIYSAFVFLLVYFSITVAVKVCLHVLGRLRMFGLGGKQFLIVGILALPSVNSFLSVCCCWCDGVVLIAVVGVKELYANFVVVMVLYLVIVCLDLSLIDNGGFFNQLHVFLVAYPFPLSFFKIKYKLDHKSFQKLKKSVWQAIFVRVIGTFFQIILKTCGVKHFWKAWSYDVDLIDLSFFVLYLVSSIVSGSAVKLLCKATPSALQLDDFWRKLSFTIVVLDLLLIQEFVLDGICGKSHISISAIVIIEMLCLVSKNIALFPANSSESTAKKVSSSSPLSHLE